MSVEMDYIFAQIKKERKRQLEKWGEQEHTDFEWLSIASEEFGETVKELNDTHLTFEGGTKGAFEARYRMQEEIIQTAAVLVAWLEQYARIGTRPPD